MNIAEKLKERLKSCKHCEYSEESIECEPCKSCTIEGHGFVPREDIIEAIKDFYEEAKWLREKWKREQIMKETGIDPDKEYYFLGLGRMIGKIASGLINSNDWKVEVKDDEIRRID